MWQKANQPPEQKLLEQSLRFLGVRSRSEHEIRQYLNRISDNEGVVEKVYAELHSLDVIDDAKFAAWFVRSRLNQKPRGPRIIALELGSKYGVDADVINRALGEVEEKEWVDAAKRNLYKRRSAIAKQPQIKQWYKAKQILYQKGFPEEIISQAIDEYMQTE